jgi:hypothetical protein
MSLKRANLLSDSDDVEELLVDDFADFERLGGVDGVDL